MPAEHPGKVSFSYKKYYSFRNKVFHTFGERFHADMQISFVANVLKYGDTQPAVVMSADPLRIAAFSDEMDAVVMLEFPAELAERYSLSPGTRLTTSCCYFRGERPKDIFYGPDRSDSLTDVVPVVQLFLGRGDAKIADKVSLFDGAVWDRVSTLGKDYLSAHPDLKRNGFFYFFKG